MRKVSRGGRKLLVGLAICAAAAFGTPTFLTHAAAAADAPVVTVTSLDMGSPLIAGDLAVQDPALAADRSTGGNPIKLLDDDGDIDHGCGLGNDADRDHDCKTGEDSSSSSSSSCEAEGDGRQDCGGGNHHCDGDSDSDDHGCSSSSSSSSSSSGGGEDVCETDGLAGPTIGDQLVDVGLPLHEPEADGPISAALVGSGDPLETSPLGPVVNEVACVVNLLTL